MRYFIGTLVTLLLLSASTAATCAWLAHQWGFESIIHLDGGSSISPGKAVPSHLLVFAKGVVKPN